MLDKNSSVLWDEYRKIKQMGNYDNIKSFMLSMSIGGVIDAFFEEHKGFIGEKELYAIKGMSACKDEKSQKYAQAYNNDIGIRYISGKYI